MEEKKSTLECVICLAFPRLPVTTQCGHIYCWSCLKDWLKTQQKQECPICKNGISLDKVIKLFVDGQAPLKEGEIDDRPKTEIVEAKKVGIVRGITRDFLSLFGVFGTQHNVGEAPLPTSRDAKQNLFALIVLIIAIFILYLVFKD